MKKKVLLAILDGWGIGDGSSSDAIAAARTPVYDQLIKDYPHATLVTHGKDVGLPVGQMGNSEVGHLNIGAGRIVFQDLVRINNAIESGSFGDNDVLRDAFREAALPGKKLHLLGLVSDGGVHSMQNHLHQLCDLAVKAGLKSVYIHAFTDGRDTDPKSGAGNISRLNEFIKHTPVKIASVVGRYYAMDRDKRWERVKKAFDLLVSGSGKRVTDPVEAMEKSYEEGITDEFIEPMQVIQEDGKGVSIQPGDVVICFNFRTDRCREITQVLTQQDMPEFSMKKLPLYYVTMTRYDEDFKNVKVIFDNHDLVMTLGEVVSQAGLKQLRIAETEKYPHVTFFFSGGREKEFPGEIRGLVPSPKVATYDLQPEMSAPQIVSSLIYSVENEHPDFICLNFANPDMVGHTGVFPAIVKAVETVDTCLGKVLDCIEKNGYSAIIIADHGNADFARNPDGSPNTAHSLNPVPFIVVDKEVKAVLPGRLADVAPTILQLMGLPQPEQMTGTSLIP